MSVVAAAVAASFILMPAAAQASAYRYWTYWQTPPASAEWAYANQGPGTAVPADGSVEGWRFAVTTESGAADAAPRSEPDFTAICADVPAGAGMKRVALVIDPGPDGIAPTGEVPIEAVTTCVSIAQDATGYDVLRSMVTVRTENGLVCALGGYPDTECAPVLDDAEVASMPSADPIVIEHGASQDASDQATSAQAEPDSGSPLVTAAVVGGLLVAGALAFVASRRRSRRG